MSEELNLVEILKDCPKGTKLYSPFYGIVTFFEIDDDSIAPKIIIYHKFGRAVYNPNGVMVDFPCGECTLFPSKDQRNWDNFKPKKPKFDPKTLMPFDKVLTFDTINDAWSCDFYSHKADGRDCFNHEFPYMCIGNTSAKVIPYNEETKHLVGTTDEAPEFYRYWEE